MRCPWSSLNVPGTGNPLSHPFLRLEDFPFSHNWTSGVIRLGSQHESEKVGIIFVQEELNGLHLVQFECPRHWKGPISSKFEVGRFPFSDNWTYGVKRMGSQDESEKVGMILARLD